VTAGQLDGDPATGVFDIAAPLLAYFDALLAPLLSDLSRLAVWAACGSIISMGLYWLFSPQKKIIRLKSEVAAARIAMLKYDGDFSGLLPIVARSLGLSLHHLALVLVPALLASLPLVFLIVWMSNTYDREFPPPGMPIRIEISPTDSGISWSAEAAAIPGGGFEVDWPHPGKPLRAFDTAGTLLFELPLAAPNPVVQKRQWWNVFFGNPSGYLPSRAMVETVEVDLPQRKFLTFGPDWARSWEVPFIGLMVVWSLTIKFVFRIR